MLPKHSLLTRLFPVLAITAIMVCSCQSVNLWEFVQDKGFTVNSWLIRFYPGRLDLGHAEPIGAPGVALDTNELLAGNYHVVAIGEYATPLSNVSPDYLGILWGSPAVEVTAREGSGTGAVYSLLTPYRYIRLNTWGDVEKLNGKMVLVMNPDWQAFTNNTANLESGSFYNLCNSAGNIAWDVAGITMDMELPGIYTEDSSDSGVSFKQGDSVPYMTVQGSSQVVPGFESAPVEVDALVAIPGSEVVELKWLDPDGGAAYRRVEITWTPEDGPAQPFIVTSGIGTATISGLNNTTAYTFTLRTVTSAGVYSPGSVVTATPRDSGSLDSSFNPGSGADDWISALLPRPDGSFLIGGMFVSYNSSARIRLAAIHSDGSLDSGFTVGSGADNRVSAIMVQSSGNIVIGGMFMMYDGTAQNYITRVNALGTYDSSFNIGTGANGEIRAIAPHPDDKLVIGGSFTDFNGVSCGNLVRLDQNGGIDPSFNPGTGADAPINEILVQWDGKILVAGEFTHINGTACNRIARLNQDGSLDTGFHSGTGADQVILSIFLHWGGQIMIGGDFQNYDGHAAGRIARLHPDGSLDGSFNSSANAMIYSVVVQEDGRIVLGGTFTAVNGTARNRLARVWSDGSLDIGFDPGTGANDFVYRIVIQQDGRLVIGGAFTTYNGTSRNRIARVWN